MKRKADRNMGRPMKSKDEVRVRMQITLAPENAKLLRDLCSNTYIPMSNLLDMMIAEYCKNNREELERKGIELYGNNKTRNR